MGAKATLIGKLPDPDMNGMAEKAQAFLDAENEDRIWTFGVRLKLRKAETDLESGDVTAKMGVVHIELVTGQDEMNFANTMLRLCSERTGITELAGFDDAFRQEILNQGEITD